MLEESKKFGFLDDSDGNHSSKRLWGSILMISGVIMAFVLFVMSLFYDIQSLTIEHGIKLIQLFFMTGGSLLGIGVFENFKIGNKNA